MKSKKQLETVTTPFVIRMDDNESIDILDIYEECVYYQDIARKI